MRFIYYHSNCPDGFGAAFAAWLYFGDTNTEYLPLDHYTTVDCDFSKDDEVYFLDISIPRAQLDKIALTAGKVIVLDHHPSNQEALKGFPGVFDLNRSGALISFDYFLPELKMEREFFEYISDRDMWTWKLQDSNAINSYFMSYEYTFDNYHKIFREFLDERRGMIIAGESIIRVNNKNVEMICSQAKEATWYTELGDFKVATVNATSHWSEVGHRLLELFPDVHFVASWFRTVEGGFKYSLRSKADFDVSKIAKYFSEKGGGHKNAAGFTLKEMI